MKLFVFGTLMDADVLRLILGHRLAPEQIQRASVRGWRRARVPGRAYPMLVPSPGGRVVGQLLSGLSPFDRQRLDAYEGAEYLLAPLRVFMVGGRGLVVEHYRCCRSVRPGRKGWSLAQWQRREKCGWLRQQANSDRGTDPSP